MKTINHRNTVYRGKGGTWWARFNGERRTPNTRNAADALYKEMFAEHERAAIARKDEGAPRLQTLEVIVLRGVPGCGKTTWAREWIAAHPQFKRINRDCLREMFDFGAYTTWNEKFVRAMRRKLIRECLQEGSSLIIDDTNLKDHDMRDIRDSAWVYSHVTGVERDVAVPIHVVEFDTPLEECIKRDAGRPTPVGADRITVMWYEFHRFNSKEEWDTYQAAKKRLEEYSG